MRRLTSEVRELLLPGGLLRFLRDLVIWSAVGLVVVVGMIALIVAATQ